MRRLRSKRIFAAFRKRNRKKDTGADNLFWKSKRKDKKKGNRREKKRETHGSNFGKNEN